MNPMIRMHRCSKAGEDQGAKEIQADSGKREATGFIKEKSKEVGDEGQGKIQRCLKRGKKIFQ